MEKPLKVVVSGPRMTWGEFKARDPLRARILSEAFMAGAAEARRPEA